MGGAVLADADRVVRPHPRRRQPCQGREPYGRAHVVGEDEEGGAEGPQHRGLERDAVHDRSHRVLADAEGDVPARVRGGEDARSLELGLRGLDEVGGAADQRGRERLQRLHHRLARVPRRDVLARREDRQRLAPPLARRPRQVELALPRQVRVRIGPGGVARLPLPLQLCAPLGHDRHVGSHLVRDGEGRVGVEAHPLLGRAHLGVAERRAVRFRGVDGVRGGVGDVAAQHDQGGALLLGLRGREGPTQRVEVLRVADVLDVPAVCLEALALVLGRIGERGGPVDRDAVVVVDVDEAAQPQVPGDRGGFVGDPFHHVAVGADRVDPRVDELVPRTVVALGEEPLRDRDADAVREALAQRAGRRLDAVGMTELRMPGCARAPLAELLQIVERDVVAGEVERRVLEDAGVAGGEHETVASGPGWIGRVVAHHVAVEQIGNRRERHRGAGMTGVRLLHRVHRERANRVDRLRASVAGHVRRA